MSQKKHKAGRPKQGTTQRRDSLEHIQAELTVLEIDIQEMDDRINQAMRRTPLVSDVLSPALARVQQMMARLAVIHREIATAWNDDQHNWRHQ